MGCISTDHKREFRKQFQTALITRVRENMFPPKEYADYGCPESPEGIPLTWDGYDLDTEMHQYIYCPNVSCCLLSFPTPWFLLLKRLPSVL
jgi:hypothetical protein